MCFGGEGMNAEIEASDGKIPRKRGRDAEIMIQADGISSFEARRINVGHICYVSMLPVIHQ